MQNLSEQLVRRYNDQVTVFTTTAAKNCVVFWVPGEPTLPPGLEQINGITVRRFAIFNRLEHVRHYLSRLADWARLPYNDWLRALFNGPLIFNMRREIARFQADVIAASSFPFLHMHYALGGGRRSGTPVVLHGALHTTDRWGFDRPMIYRAIQQAQGYIANSEFERQYLVERGIDPAKITTIGVGVELEQFTAADGSHMRAALGWQNEPVIAFVGQLAYRRKGIPHLVAAMRQVWQAHPQARLLLAGSRTSDTGLLKEEVHRLAGPHAGRVTFRESFPEAEKAALFAACDMLVLPSQEESFGIVLLEAWACRKPVIGLRGGAIPTIISEGEDGLLADPRPPAALAQAITHLLAHPEQGRRLGQAGYQKVKNNYTWEIVADKFRQVYQQAIAGG